MIEQSEKASEVGTHIKKLCKNYRKKVPDRRASMCKGADLRKS